MSSDKRFAFTKIFVDDIEAQSSFYRAVFEMREKGRLTVGTGRTPWRRSSSPADATTIRH